MPTVALLYIDDSIVGPLLQLLRQVCEPSSTSRPHVTVRYFERLDVPDEYREARVRYIDLIEPGMFEPEKNVSRKGNTRIPTPVFIRCKSDDLAPLEHKPHFPGSDFHITVYDGPSIRFARDVLQELKRYKWAFRVPFRTETGLTIRELKKSGHRKPPTERVYADELKTLFRLITSQELTRTYLVNLSIPGRLGLCRAILTYLFRVIQQFERVTVSARRTPKRFDGRVANSKLLEVHLTPPELAREITAYTIRQIETLEIPVDFGDPAVGTGAFYGALLHLLRADQIASAIGIDINPEQVAAAKWRWSDKGMQVLIGDYLHMDRLSRRTLVLANPPYLRHQSIPPEYKERLRERASIRTHIRISARSGLYVYFLLLGHDWMRAGAVAGWLIPSEFMRAGYGSAVRQYLTEKVELLRVHIYGEDAPQFENVDVAPAVIIFRNRKPQSDHSVVMTSGGGLEDPNVTDTVALTELRGSATWAVPFFKETAIGRQYRIRDLFVIRRGIATGANEFFILTRKRAKELGIPKFAIRPLLPKVRALETDIVEAGSDGYPTVSPQLCVIDCDFPEHVIRSKYPRLWEYLGTAHDLGILNRRLLKDRNLWYKQESREPAPFLCTYMGRGSKGKPPIRFIWNKSKAIATNTYLFLYPRPAIAAILSRRPAAAGDLFLALQEASLIGMREHARVYAGGLLKIEPRGLGEVRISIPSSFAPDKIDEQLSLFR